MVMVIVMVIVIVIGVLELKVIIVFCIIKRQFHNYFEMIGKRLGSRLNPDSIDDFTIEV